VRKDGSLETLEQECHRRNNLPSIAYGFKSCSQKHKIAPQDKFLNHWTPAIEWWDGDKWWYIKGNRVKREDVLNTPEKLENYLLNETLRKI
jgi:hypothetical protein